MSVRKKKVEEEEAELKRKHTDAAYQGISFPFKGKMKRAKRSAPRAHLSLMKIQNMWSMGFCVTVSPSSSQTGGKEHT